MENDDEENKTTLGEVIAQIFGIAFFCYLAYGAVIEIYQEIKRLTYNEENAIDKLLIKINEKTPNQLSYSVFENVSREGKNINQTYTIAKNHEYIDSAQFQKYILNFQIKECTKITTKEIMSHGYSLVYIFNTQDKKNAFKLVIDKFFCETLKSE